MKFETPEMQARWTDYQAKMNSPEVVARAAARLIDARKSYWGSILFMLPAMSLVANMAFMWLLIRVYHVDPAPLAWLTSIGFPAFIGAALYPRN